MYDLQLEGLSVLCGSFLKNIEFNSSMFKKKT